MNRRTKVKIYNAIVIVLLLAGIAYVVTKFVHFGNVEYTDNAYVHQHITPVNSRVQGFLKEVYFSEYQPVKKGDTLAIIEDTEFRLKVAQAEATLANARTGRSASETTVAATRSNVGANDAAIAEAKAQLDNAQREEERFRRLLERNAVTQQQYDLKQTALAAAQARYDQLKNARQATALTSNELNERLQQGDATIRAAEAALDLAHLNLSYTVIIAPCDGVLGRKDVNPGQLVQPGQTIVDIVDSGSK